MIIESNENRRKELADFLRTRRERLSPQDVGLPPDAKRRRTPGLRREEVAVLAGISLPWYVSLEQGRDIRVSDEVLVSLARTLRLDAAEREHLFLLANQKTCPTSAFLPQPVSVPSSLQLHLEQLEPCPAYIHDSRWNVRAWNRMAAELFGDYAAMAEEERNTVWLMFTRPEYRERFVQWEELAQSVIAQFRISYGKYLHDPWYPDMVERLSDRSPEFREWWSRHEIQTHPDSPKTFRHPQAGLLTLQPNSFALLDQDGSLFLKTMMPAPRTDTMEKLTSLLGSLREHALPV
ncbi:helix-turn-helix transcriptional regulator [Cohnella caldifontis]|uniref:helix-turn-helix transcriptional regulator n=1 Tax=Cohnella caldifontis TaxID=3027471 RepID=UPI0023EE281F|nr:helix-turn-helix transcriptional regulator [Cohnella sp. YIM B05605]